MRYKDTDWKLNEGTPNAKGGTTHQWESIHVAILMDIRDELKELNRLLGCSNFIGMPATLRIIRTYAGNIARRLAK